MHENNYLQLKNYFQDLVEQSNFLNSFVGFFQREWANRSSSTTGLQEPYLALFRYEMGLDGAENNTVAIRSIGFGIMYNNVKPDDYEEQYKAISNAELLAIKVLSRIRHDSYIDGHFLHNAFLKDSVEITPVELSAKSFGVEVSFNLRNSQILSINAADWKDIDNVCS